MSGMVGLGDGGGDGGGDVDAVGDVDVAPASDGAEAGIGGAFDGGDPLLLDGDALGVGGGVVVELALALDDQVEGGLACFDGGAGDEVGLVVGPDVALAVAPGDLPAEAEVAGPGFDLGVEVEFLGGAYSRLEWQGARLSSDLVVGQTGVLVVLKGAMSVERRRGCMGSRWSA